MNQQADITQMLSSISDGNQQAYDKVFPMVYDELKNIASKQLNREYGGHTFSRTELVHEAYMKLIDQTRIDYNDRNHFYAIAARSMRQILVDYARKKKAEKRGGNQEDLTLNEKYLNIEEHAQQIIELDEHLKELSKLDERLVQIVELRFFAGLSIEDTSDMLDISTSTANRDWAKARGWLYQRINK